MLGTEDGVVVAEEGEEEEAGRDLVKQKEKGHKKVYVA